MAVPSSDGFDEVQLNEVAAQCVLDFEAWITLISNVEQMYHDDIDKISLVYDSFLSEFPLCYGYWKKYAEHKARLCSVEDVLQIFERAVESAPYSVGLWLEYCSFCVSSFENPFDVCRLFDRGLSFVGKDYMCYKLWDKYIEFEFSQQNWNSLANIYIQTLKFPTKKLHQYYESYRKLVTIWEEEIGCEESSRNVQFEHEINGQTKTFEDAEIAHVINDLLDPSARSKALLKYISIGESLYQRACDLDAKVQKFEQNIRRPYFHVKPLDDNQLQNWHRYLDLVEMKGDFDWAVKLYERCLISCANYPEFWMRYVDYVESKGGREIASDAIERATHIFLKNAPEIHLFSAWFKEKTGDLDGVHAAFQKCDHDSESCFIDIVRRKANMERRQGNYVAASNIYKEALDLAAEKRPDTLPMLYVHLARLQYVITNNVEVTREVLLNGVQRAPNSKVLLKELILFALTHEGALQVETLDSIMTKALSPKSDVSGDLSTEEWEDISRLYLEFVDFCGSIHDLRKAWNRHMKLFPHLVRVQSSFKKPAKVGLLWKMITEGRPGSVNTCPRSSSEKHGKDHLIELPPEEAKLLGANNSDQSGQAIHGQEESEDGIGSLNNMEPVPLEVTESSIKDACKASDPSDQVAYQAAGDRDLVEAVKDSKSNSIKQEIEQKQKQEFPQEQPSTLHTLCLDPQDDQHIIASPSPGMDPPAEPSPSNGNTPANGHNINEVPSTADPTSPRDNAAERCNESPCPSSILSQKTLPEVSPRRPLDREVNWRRLNPSGKGRSDASPGNSEERLERSLSPRRRNSQGYLDDRRHRERSLSPRRHNSRRHSEDRWHRDRRYRRYNRYQDNSRGHRDGRLQNHNQVVVGNAMQIGNAQQQTMGFASQPQLPVQPIAYTQGQTIQCPLPSNDQYGNAQSSQLYNQMWQYYYYNQQQQQLLLQQPLGQQQQLQQLQPHQQLQQQIPNPSQQQMQTPQQPQQIQPHQQQLLQLQYQQQQLYQMPQFQQQLQQPQPNEQPQSKEQQLQLQQQMQLPQQQSYQHLHLQQQEQQQQAQIQQQQQAQIQLQQQVPIQQQQQPQVQQQQPQVQQEEVDVQQQQQQAYQYQQLQQQQYLLYLQQLQQYQQSQQQTGLRQDQQTMQQQQFPIKQEEQEIFPEPLHRDDKSQSQPQQNDGSSQVGSGSSSQYQQDRGVEHSHTSVSGAAALPQPLDELPEIEGTDQ